MKPTIGRIVIYNATVEDQEFMRLHPNCNMQQQLPAIIVAVWSDTCLNLRVLCDGDVTLWKTSVTQGDSTYNWNWPVKSE